MKRILDGLSPSRREVLKWGGVALASSFVERGRWPLEVRAAAKANPRGSARNCIFVEMGGCISPMECWDAKETEQTPKDLDYQKVTSELTLSKTLFPLMSKYMNRVGLVRSMRAS